MFWLLEPFVLVTERIAFRGNFFCNNFKIVLIFFTKFQDNIFKFEPIGALVDEKSLADEADDVIVTEEDIDEELIEIDIDLSYDNSEVIQESVIRKVEKEVASIQVHEEEKPPPSLPIKVITE